MIQWHIIIEIGVIKRKLKKYTAPNRILKMYCPIHGNLEGYTQSYEIIVYESFNQDKNKVQLKCFKCLEEPIKKENEYHLAVNNEVNKEGYKRFGRKAKIYEYMSQFFGYITFFGYYIFLGFYLDG